MNNARFGIAVFFGLVLVVIGLSAFTVNEIATAPSAFDSDRK